MVFDGSTPLVKRCDGFDGSLWSNTNPQGGRSWQPFVESKNGHANFCEVRIYYFRDKCVVFARNSKFENLTQYNMQYIPCNSALLAQEPLFLTQKGTFFIKYLNHDKIACVRA